MKKSIETLKNCWKIGDLRQRLLITVLFTAIYRFGSFAVLPDINPALLERLQAQTKGGPMSLLDMFSDGAFSHTSIFALGIMPYISVSIVMQLLVVAVPYFQKMQREGKNGHKRINWYTYVLTVVILLFQAPSYLVNLKMQAAGALVSDIDWTIFMIPATIILAVGSMLVLWLGEHITDKDVGNGISTVIMISIIARLPQALILEFGNRVSEAIGSGVVILIIEIIIFYVVIYAAVLLTQGARKIPVQYARRVVGNKQYGGARQYIPLKLFAVNIMPIIFAQALIFIPLAIVQYSSNSTSSVLQSLMNAKSLAYNYTYVPLIVVFAYFYTAITLSPTQMAEDMERSNGFIPDVKPGRDTADYTNTVMSRLTEPGALFTAFIATMPALAGYLNVADAFSRFSGGTSLSVLVGVVIGILRQIESYLMMRHYDGPLNSGHTRDNSGVAAY